MNSRSRVFSLVAVVCAALTATAQQPPAASKAREIRLDYLRRQTTTRNALALTAVTFANPLGVEVEAADAALRAQLGIDDDLGVVVTGILEQSEAAKAGLKQYDVVLKVGDQTIASTEKFNELIAKQQGETVRLHLLRQGKRLLLELTLPKETAYSIVSGMEGVAADGSGGLAAVVLNEPRYRMGVTLAEADDTLRGQLRLAAGEGLVVTEVVPDWPAAGAGIRLHDVLTKLDGRRLTTVDAINAQIQKIKDRKVSVTFFRAGREMTCELAPRLSNEPATFGFGMGFSGMGGGMGADMGPGGMGPGGMAGSGGMGPMGSMGHGAAGPMPGPEQASVAREIADLKRQLAAMQKTLQSLEASLQSRAGDDPPAQGKNEGQQEDGKK